MFPNDIPMGSLISWPAGEPIPAGWGMAYIEGKLVTASPSSVATIIIIKLDNLTWIEQEAKKRNLI